jgi:hypothetical protein
MQIMARESWTDERLDEFGKRMDERFDRADERIDELRREMNQGFGRVDERFDAMRSETRQDFNGVDKRLEQMDKQFNRIGIGLETVQRALIFGSITMSTAFVAGFLTLAVKL